MTLQFWLSCPAPAPVSLARSALAKRKLHESEQGSKSGGTLTLAPSFSQVTIYVTPLRTPSDGPKSAFGVTGASPRSSKFFRRESLSSRSSQVSALQVLETNFGPVVGACVHAVHRAEIAGTVRSGRD